MQRKRGEFGSDRRTGRAGDGDPRRLALRVDGTSLSVGFNVFSPFPQD